MKRIFRSGKSVAEQRGRGQRFLRGNVAGAMPSRRRARCPRSLLAQSQMPMPLVQCLIAASMSRYCRCICLSRDDHVDVVLAAQAVVGDRQQQFTSGGR